MCFTVEVIDPDRDPLNHPATIWLIENLGPCINAGDPHTRRLYRGEEWTAQPAILRTPGQPIPFRHALIYKLSDNVSDEVKFEFVLRFR